MDYEMLSFLMHDSATYENIPKEFFLKKLSDTFDDIKISGDTALVAYEGTCKSNACNNNGCNGYSFIGNFTKNHLDFIFEGTDECISDIFLCYGFYTKDRSLEKKNRRSFTFSDDDKPDFKPSFDYLVKNEKCISAYEELMKHQKIIIDKEIYIKWIEKYAPFFETFESVTPCYSNYEKFYNL